MGINQSVNIPTVIRRMIQQMQKALNIGQRHVQIPAVAHKGEPLQMRRTINAIAVCPSAGGTQKAHPLIVTDGVRTYPRCLPQNANLHKAPHKGNSYNDTPLTMEWRQGF